MEEFVFSLFVVAVVNILVGLETKFQNGFFGSVLISFLGLLGFFTVRMPIEFLLQVSAYHMFFICGMMVQKFEGVAKQCTPRHGRDNALGGL